jgi:hypothetical protein
MNGVSAKKSSGEYFSRAGKTDATLHSLFENRVKGINLTGVGDSLAALPIIARSLRREADR